MLLNGAHHAVCQMMGRINCWGVDMFRLSDVTKGRPLTAVAYTISQVISRVCRCLKIYYSMYVWPSAMYDFPQYVCVTNADSTVMLTESCKRNAPNPNRMLKKKNKSQLP